MKTKKNKEYILCSAIKYNGIVICGHRHNDCYKILTDLLLKFTKIDLPKREDQGFLTSTNRFVDRKEAFLIANENKQIIYGSDSMDVENQILISENLY